MRHAFFIPERIKERRRSHFCGQGAILATRAVPSCFAHARRVRPPPRLHSSYTRACYRVPAPWLRSSVRRFHAAEPTPTLPVLLPASLRRRSISAALYRPPPKLRVHSRVHVHPRTAPHRRALVLSQLMLSRTRLRICKKNTPRYLVPWGVILFADGHAQDIVVGLGS